MGKQDNKFMNKKQHQNDRQHQKSERNKANLVKAKAEAEANAATSILGTDTPVLTPEVEAQGNTIVKQMVSKFAPKIEASIAPLAESIRKQIEEARKIENQRDRAWVAVKVIREAQREAMDTPGHTLHDLMEELRKLQIEISNTKIVDGVRVPRAVAGTTLVEIARNIESGIKQVKQQISVVIAAEFGLTADEAHDIVRKDEQLLDARVEARKGQYK